MKEQHPNTASQTLPVIWTSITTDWQLQITGARDVDARLLFDCTQESMISRTPGELAVGTDARNREQAMIITEGLCRARELRRRVCIQYVSYLPTQEAVHVMAYAFPAGDHSICMEACEIDKEDLQRIITANTIPTTVQTESSNPKLSLPYIVKDHLPIGLELYDRDGLLIDINQTEIDIMGITDRNSLLGLNLFDNPNLSDEIKKKLHAGEDINFSVEYDFGKGNGYFKSSHEGISNFDTSISVIRNKSGEISAYLLISQDYSILSNKYENMYNQMLTILNSLPVGVELYDSEGKVEFLNDTDANLFGIFDLEEVFRKKPSIYDNPNVPDKVKNAVRDKVPVSLRFPYNFKTITKTDYYSTNKIADDCWVECNGTPIIDKKGRVTSYTFVMEDVTDKKRAEEELKESTRKTELILNNTNSGLAYITPDYIVQWENITTCSRSFSYEAYKQGEPCYRSAHGLQSPCEDCVMQRAMQSGQVEQKKFHLQGNRIVEVFATPVSNDNGKLEGIVIRVDDITDRERMIKELWQAKARAEQSDKLKSAFLANMSHEIRTPLNAIVGFSNLLLEAEEQEEKDEYTQIISNNNDLLLKLINDILDLSKIEAGSVDLKYEEFDFADYFNRLSVSMKQRMIRPEVQLKVISPYEVCRVNLDKNRIAQILTNYVINAIKYTAVGYIAMGYEVIETGIRIYVKDTGIGIPDEKKEKIFHRFEKLDEFAQGTGLGLSICKAIAETMGGEVGFNSVYGKGSTFWAEFPCNTEITQDTPTGLPTETCYGNAVNPAPGNKNQSERKTILVAEDISSNFLLVSALLRKNYNLLHATTGLEAVEMARTGHPDLVLMDMKMPVMNGLTATTEIRKFDTHLPIVALTAHAFDSDRKAALAAGCNEYLVKPLNRTQLFDILNKFWN